MLEYLASQIIYGKLTYQKVMTKFSGNKEEIDMYLRKKGRENLIEDLK
ncbi:hypothetical protein LZ906_006790 [Paraclostridium ghonii]|nr:hypothetical protein [Paeniclostridium ghonii]MCM0165923.1 hypothetical protein [Paeniclostridium ghonii]